LSACEGDCNDRDARLNLEDNDNDGFSSCDGDCDDTDPTLNAIDKDDDGYSNCDGDCNDADASLNLDDLDEDGFSTCDNDCDDDDATRDPADADGDGFSTCENDCDDENSALRPVDNDNDGYSTCDGDCNDYDATLEIADLDGDGFSTCDGDCDDNDASLVEHCSYTETIELGDLIGLGSTCSTGPNLSMYNGCGGSTFGFEWMDTAGKMPAEVLIVMNRGISCGSYTTKLSLNNQSAGSFQWSYDTSSCNCEPSTSLLTWSVTDLGGFNPNGINQFLISSDNCEGLTENPDWGDAYAQITVTY
jgi:hypothetical protein